MILFYFFCSSASFNAMQLEHCVLAKLAAQKHFCSYRCLTLQNAIISFLTFCLLLHPAVITLLLLLIFCGVISAWDDDEEEEQGKPPPPNTRAHNHTHNENTMDNLKTWWDFRAQWKTLDDSGWGGCSASIWLTSFCSVCAQRGREQSTVPWQPH